MNAIAFTKVALPYGWLGNMAPFPVRYCLDMERAQGPVWPTTEHLFQAMRFSGNTDMTRMIRAARSPMAAKMIAKKFSSRMVVVPRGPYDLENMRRVLRIKIAQHPALGPMLLATGTVDLIEDVTRRAPAPSALFWGMARTEEGWAGDNWLGRLWAEVRSELRAAAEVPDS